MRRPNHNPGFTIVELLIVIVVIGILAAITIVAYSGIQGRAVAASLTSDLVNASSKLQLYQVDNSAYPTSNDCSATPAIGSICLKSSNGNSYTAFQTSNTGAQFFCLTATNNGTSYRLSNASTATVGTCSISDTFTRTNSATSLGVADSGQIWQTDGSIYGISGNQGYMVNGSGTAWINRVVPAITVEMDITYASSTTESVITRLVDASNYLHVIINDGAFYLYKKDAGAWGQLAIVARTHIPGVTYRIKAEIVGNVFNGYENGVLVLSYVLTPQEQAKFLAANALGVGMRSSSSAVRYGNLMAM